MNIVSRIPDHYIRVDDGLGRRHKSLQMCTAQIRVGRETLTVIDLTWVVAQHPKVAHTIGSRDAVVRARPDCVRFATNGIADAPLPLVSRIALSLDFELLRMPIAV